MKKLKNIIFDCDGVLVDSEILANRVEAELKTELGFPTTTEEQIQKFVGFGSNHPVMIEELKRLPKNYLETVDQRIHKIYETELKAIYGVLELLQSLENPICVASSSEPEWINQKLKITQLKPFFDKSIFSGHMVKATKPAPDLFLFAAHKMEWDISECLVIEDSVAGVIAGRAAGMTVCGFLGGSHILPGHAERLIQAGADYIVSDIRKIKPLLQ